MSLAPIKVFQDFVYGAMTETVAQQVQKFNDASAGALRLVNAKNVGDIKQKASFAAISGLVRRRDAYGSGTLTATSLTQRQENSVKVAGGTLPVKFEEQQYSFIQLNPKVAGITLGEQLAPAMIQDQLNSAIRCGVAAIGGNANVKHDSSAGATTFDSLNKAAAKFGDYSGNLVCWVMHSKVAHDLYSNALTNGAFLFNYGNISVMRDPFGRLFVITDAPALVIPGTPNRYIALGLTRNAIMVEDNGDFNDTMLKAPGTENITTTYQAEWSFNVGVMGYSWTASTGGSSPTDTALGTSANWTKTASFDKTTAGVMLTAA
jgi:hypothetical protein